MNLLLMGYDEDIFSLLDKNLTIAQLQKLKCNIIDYHGVTEENARYIIKTWLGVVFKKKFPTGGKQSGSSKLASSWSAHHAASLSDASDGNFAQELRRIIEAPRQTDADNDQREWLNNLRRVFGDADSSNSFFTHRRNRSPFYENISTLDNFFDFIKK